eukprot:7383227-Prymnesium_polylepis.1
MAIEEHLRTCEHMYDLVAGICDGSLVAATVAQLAKLPYLNCCAPPWSGVPTTVDLQIHSPSLHLLGLNDELLERAALMDVPSRSMNATILWHSGGHQIPILTPELRARVVKWLEANRVEPFSSGAAQPATDTKCAESGVGIGGEEDNQAQDSMMLLSKASGAENEKTRIQMRLNGIATTMLLVHHYKFMLFVKARLWLQNLPSEGTQHYSEHVEMIKVLAPTSFWVGSPA